jgi:hypothetical protein
MTSSHVKALLVCAAAALCLSLCAGASTAAAQNAPEAIPPLPKDYILLTIFLRHDESKPLPEIQKELRQHNWMRDFPPTGAEVESWYIMMGIGQVVTLRVPPEKVREVNRMVEEKAWGAFRTEFYLTYDYKSAAKAEHEKAQEAK